MCPAGGEVSLALTMDLAGLCVWTAHHQMRTSRLREVTGHASHLTTGCCF